MRPSNAYDAKNFVATRDLFLDIERVFPVTSQPPAEGIPPGKPGISPVTLATVTSSLYRVALNVCIRYLTIRPSRSRLRTCNMCKTDAQMNTRKRCLSRFLRQIASILIFTRIYFNRDYHNWIWNSSKTIVLDCGLRKVRSFSNRGLDTISKFEVSQITNNER